jgi:membrane protein
LKRAYLAFVRFCDELVRSQHRDQLSVRAGALAYTTLLSIVPLLTVALVTVARVQPERAAAVVTGIATILPFSPARVRATLATFAERTAGLGWLAIVISILVTFQAFYQIEEVINAIWGVPRRRRWQWRLLSFGTVLLTGPVLLTALFSGLYWLSSRSWYPAISLLARPLPSLLAMVVLGALYKWVPHTRVPWRAAWIGAAVASVGLTALNLGFQSYYFYAADLNVVYGSLAILLFFLLSLFLFWLAILLGAEASWVVGHASPVPHPERMDALVRVFLAIERRGSLAHGYAREMLGEGGAEVLRRMADPPALLARTRSAWRLARSADEIPLSEIRIRSGFFAANGNTDPGDSRTLATVIKQEDSGVMMLPMISPANEKQGSGNRGQGEDPEPI